MLKYNHHTREVNLMATTLILGASDKIDRFSNQAQRKLVQHGFQVVLVNPKGGEIDGVRCYKQISEVEEAVDTVTVYINPSRILQQVKQIVNLKPRRVIFNPGSESSEAAELLIQYGIEAIENCTLIMLDIDEY
jgi:uncharacterized protein